MVAPALVALGGVLVLSSLGRASAIECSFPQRVVFAHAWEADPSASWRIDSLALLDSVTGDQLRRCDQAREHGGEVIVSALTSSIALGPSGIDSLEGEWREREVGEGIEETLERAVRRHLPLNLLGRTSRAADLVLAPLRCPCLS
jgi:hypothetical protein